ncbi:MAG: hypothetical protein ACTHU0_21525 [Kofleriaceae bacterium]
MSQKPTKVYVTKYALTEGIIACKVINFTDRGYAHVLWPGGTRIFGRHDWWPTEEVARAKADQMIRAKIAALKKQVAKLEKLSEAGVQLTEKT